MKTIEDVEQWNMEHPEDCHSPYMGIIDEETTEETEAEVEETTEEIQQDPQTEIKTSPKTGDPGATGWILLVTITGLALLGILWKKKLETK